MHDFSCKIFAETSSGSLARLVTLVLEAFCYPARKLGFDKIGFGFWMLYHSLSYQPAQSATALGAAVIMPWEASKRAKNGTIILLRNIIGY